MKLRPTRGKKGRRGRKRQQHIFENSLALTGRMSLQYLAWPRTVNPAKLLSLVCLAGLTWLLFYFFSAERFYIYAADISGNQFISSEEIFAKSGLGTLSVFYVNPSQVSRRLVQLANIKEAQVTVRLPGRASISVTERLPQVVLDKGGTRYWVDSEGVVLPARGDLTGATVLVDTDNTDLKPGDRVDIEALHTARQLRELLPEVTHLAYSRVTGISLVTSQGWPVLFGTSENLPVKVATYRALVEKLSQEGSEVELIDLRFEGRPYYRRRGQ